jgi:hypothetical protein
MMHSMMISFSGVSRFSHSLSRFLRYRHAISDAASRLLREASMIFGRLKGSVIA